MIHVRRKGCTRGSVPSLSLLVHIRTDQGTLFSVVLLTEPTELQVHPSGYFFRSLQSSDEHRRSDPVMTSPEERELVTVRSSMKFPLF
ncbi:hypothetical protein [Methanomethylovorans sp.]|uniref:hypothetical protein n=1 Tax=Methanomethylovorans sp. TaxID=2758717 RepID=UPI00345ED0A0